MTDQQSDLVILGGGSGRYACALRASELGLSVTLIEEAELGGTCLHRGVSRQRHCSTRRKLPTQLAKARPLA